MPKGPDHTTRCGALSPRLFPSPLSLLRIQRNVRGSQTSAQRFPWPWLSFTRRTDFNKHSAEWADNVTINTKKTRNLRTDWHSGDRWWSTAVVVAFRVGNEGSRERGEWKPCQPNLLSLSLSFTQRGKNRRCADGLQCAGARTRDSSCRILYFKHGLVVFYGAYLLLLVALLSCVRPFSSGTDRFFPVTCVLYFDLYFVFYFLSPVVRLGIFAYTTPYIVS